ncbi:hypothetical protein Ari01nite_54680 [Paractinoplanes rishiriensis]|uniref:Uncharacterized protein n=2 Tax=Paractinoplanes rishiriensis TaxID=1050105 RepID=A0A919MWM6_9ACTN|nr:hypothetical protein Ari01nite_54680 [Actinoplanes rishiriensis]
MRGVVLYGCAAALLAGGGTWWFTAAPRAEIDPQIEQWTQAAHRVLPDAPDQHEAETVALRGGYDHEVVAELEPGKYWVSVLCVGGASSHVRVTLGAAGTDSGLGLTCAGDNKPDVFSVGIADRLRMQVSVNDAGPVVFRYALLRDRD